MNKSAQDVKLFVRQYFHEKKVTQKTVGDEIGFTRQAVANLFSDKSHYFTRKTAVLFHYLYGFTIPFLMEGKGQPFIPGSTIEDVVNHLKERLKFLREIATNTTILTNLGESKINADILKGMEHAFNDILQYINSGQYEKI